MAKMVCNYGSAKLVECPERWEYYKELWFADVPLLLYKSERKYPGKKFFSYGSLRSSIIEKLWSEQETINSPLYINIQTKNSFYKFRLDPREEE